MTHQEKILKIAADKKSANVNTREFIVAGDDLDVLYMYAMRWAELQDFREKYVTDMESREKGS